MLTPILATDDPYEAAAAFVEADWSLVFQTPPDSGDPLAYVALAGAQVMLGTSVSEFLPAESRAHKGAGVEFHVAVADADIDAVYEAHRRNAESVTELLDQPWGERAFHAVLVGYRFPIAAGAKRHGLRVHRGSRSSLGEDHADQVPGLRGIQPAC